MFSKKKITPEMLEGRVNSVAIITDGNGRWATKRGLKRSAGHIEGAKRIQPVDMFPHTNHGETVVCLKRQI